MRVAGKLGKLAHRRPAGLKDLVEYAKHPLPAAPKTLDLTTGISSFEMADNDTLGDCLAPNTKVLTADLTWVPIKSLMVGDELVGFDEFPEGAKPRKYRTSVVERVKEITKPCYDLTLSDGTVIRASFDHQWLRKSRDKNGSWLTTEDMVCGQVRSSSLMRCFDTWQLANTYFSGYLAGALDGEGCIAFSHDNGTVKAVQFSQRANQMLDTVQRYLELFGIKSTQMDVDKSSLSDKGYSYLRVSHRDQVIRLLGLTQPPRLMSKFSPDKMGTLHTDAVSIVKKEFVGNQKVIAVQTSTRTFIAEGFASHNCTIAGVTHLDKVWCNITSETYTYPGDSTISDFYFSMTGGDDTGLVEADVLNHWKSQGIFNREIVAFAPVKTTDFDTMKAACNLFGGLYIGIQLPSVAMNQFELGEPWDLTNTAADDDIEGGHCVDIVGYDDNSNWKVITWGTTQTVTTRWFAKYLDEVWAVISGEFKADAKIDLKALQTDLANLPK